MSILAKLTSNLTKGVISLVLVSGLGFFLMESATANVWDDYKARYITAEGAVVDTQAGGKKVSHSEGQSYGMLFALAYNDKETFDKIYKWTRKYLKNKDNGLFYWVYRHDRKDKIADKNNASDGDLVIALALLRASERWGVKKYKIDSEHIANNILFATVTKYAGKHVMLPGENGFYYNSSITLNPSYFVFPAFAGIYNHTHISAWKNLYDDSLKILDAINSMNVKVKLPPDWISMDAAGKVKPAKEWPARSSYDAIRVPVYIYWVNPRSPLLTPWKNWFIKYPNNSCPAWVNIATAEVAPYKMPPGLEAVRQLVMGVYPDSQMPEPVLTSGDDYYNASLKILTFLANRHF